MGDAGLILLDTQALVWYVAGSPQLGVAARRAVESALAVEELPISAISFCEVTWLHRLGRLALLRQPQARRESVRAEGVGEIQLSGRVAIAAAELADFHKDPAYRLIVATALDEGARLPTADRQILAWPRALERIDARL